MKLVILCEHENVFDKCLLPDQADKQPGQQMFVNFSSTWFIGEKGQ